MKPQPLNTEWLARTAEIDGSWWLAPEPIRVRARRRYGLYATGVVGVLCIAILTIAALVILP